MTEASNRPTSVPLVMLHGLFGDGDNLRALERRLDTRREILRLDLPGHGGQPPTTPLDPVTMAVDIAAHLSDAGIERCDLLGHSLGGKIAMLLAGRGSSSTSGLVRRLIVIDIAPKAYPPHHRPIIDALRGLPLDSLADRRDADERLASTIGEAPVRAFLLKSLVRDAAGWSWRFDLDAIDRDYALLSAALPGWPAAADEPAAIRQPTLLVRGGASDYVTAADEPALQRWFHDLSIRTVGGSGHWVHAENSEAVAALVDAFLD